MHALSCTLPCPVATSSNNLLGCMLALLSVACGFYRVAGGSPTPPLLSISPRGGRVHVAVRRGTERARSIAMAGLSAMELLLFHKLERDLFHRLVHDLGQDPATMRWVIALWLWFESAGHHDFIRRVSALPGPVVTRFVEEAITCLRRLAGKGAAADAGDEGRDGRLPCTNALLAESVDDVGYFDARREEILDGVTSMYKNVCLVVCDAGSAATCVPSNMGVARAAPPPQMVSSPGRAAPPVPSWSLNPMASPWIPVQAQSLLPEDYRSLFITFSRGYPISKEDIVEFFNSAYGPCVEAVMVERPPPGQLPVYGRVVLRNAAMIPVVLDGKQTNKFLIKGRHLWARIYVPSSRLVYYA
ncbi:hypothetical protein ACP70R_020865 [Stipagrostis hirtigluma subsp. patula]